MKRIMLNFSNHPYDEWQEKQKKEALAFGEIEEIAFPQIDPNLSHEDVLRLSVSYTTNIIAKYAGENELTVHIMGEMTFTYMVVARLKDMGIRCVASTTERKVYVMKDGTKMSSFHFVRFREY